MSTPLVEPAWLEERLDDPDLRVVDIRGHTLPAGSPYPQYFSHRAEYAEGHIPGAVFVDWTGEITEDPDPTRTKVAPPDRFAAAMGAIGVGGHTHVVAYDDAEGMFAARLWWALRYHGHEHVSVLDGGWPRWVAEGRPVTPEVPDVRPAAFVPRPDPALRRTLDQVLAALGGPAVLVDTRPANEYRGEVSRARRNGRIPGAVSVPRADLVTADGLLRDPEELRARFAAAGVGAGGGEVILYCSGGVAASLALLALTRAGIAGGTLYDGSWREWGNSDDTPVEA